MDDDRSEELGDQSEPAHVAGRVGDHAAPSRFSKMVVERHRLSRVLVAVVRVTPLRSARVRRVLRSARWAAARQRRLRAERHGSERYSRPAAHDMDAKLQRLLPDTGFFVEAGAYDGYTESNTYYLERFRGWTGVLVEPVHEYYRRALRERPRSAVVHCALVPPEQAGEQIRIRHAGTMSIVEGARGSDGKDEAYLASALLFAEDGYDAWAPGRTLSDVLDELNVPEVDLLSLDLEGFESRALEGLDLERHRPRHILVEVQDESNLRAVADRLGAWYGSPAQTSPRDALFTRLDVYSSGQESPAATA
jgi:FkbM family methyltransferase